MHNPNTADQDTLAGGRAEARAALDAWVREVVAWHFDPATGCPFWLNWASKAGWDPRTVNSMGPDVDVSTLDGLAVLARTRADVGEIGVVESLGGLVHEGLLDGRASLAGTSAG